MPPVWLCIMDGDDEYNKDKYLQWILSAQDGTFRLRMAYGTFVLERSIFHLFTLNASHRYSKCIVQHLILNSSLQFFIGKVIWYRILYKYMCKEPGSGKQLSLTRFEEVLTLQLSSLLVYLVQDSKYNK